MAIIRKKIRVNSQPWITTAAVVPVASSEPVQEYDVVTNTYYPDRAVSPLVLDPIVGYSDSVSGESSSNAAALLTDGHWYRLDNATSGSGLVLANEITSGANFIIDTVAGSATYGRLTVKENVQPGNTVTYVFRCTLPTPSGNIVKTMSWRARSHAVETLPELVFDNMAESTFDPLNESGNYVITASLKPAVTGATFAWETCHKGVWGALDSTHYDWALSASGAALTVKRDVMQDQILFRCRAQFTAGGKAQSLLGYGSVTRRLPKYEYDIVDVAGVNEGTRTVSPRARIRLGNRVLTDPKGELLVIWYNAANQEIGRGLNPVFSMPGNGAALEVGLDVKDAEGFKCLELGNGDWLVDGQGRILIAKCPEK